MGCGIPGGTKTVVVVVEVLPSGTTDRYVYPASVLVYVRVTVAVIVTTSIVVTYGAKLIVVGAGSVNGGRTNVQGG